jgi:hypothetical protein
VLTRKKLQATSPTAAFVAATILAVPASASAANPACSSFSNPVYISGSSAAKPVLQALATTLANDGVPVSIIFSSPDSCLGVNDLILSQPSTESGVTPSYLAPNGTTSMCTLDSSNPQPPDIAVSDVFPATCVVNFGLTIPATVVDVQGPIQAMTMAVPGGTSGSSASAISAKAAYVVFGVDAVESAYIVAPWTVSSNIFVRPSTSGTLDMIGAAIGLVPSKWVNASITGTAPAQQQSSTGNMENAVAKVTSNQNATIGILAAEAVVAWNSSPTSSSTPLKILAFQANNQSCGYLPDSSITALDKINVRLGSYAIWGPLHFLVNTSAGEPTGPDAPSIATVLNYFLATGPNPNATPFTGDIADEAGAGVSVSDMQALISAEAKPGYLVPWCAMTTQRSSEVGAEASYSSPEPCACFFEETVNGAPVAGHTCTPCTNSGDCTGSAPVCRYGYCEVQ